MSASLLPVAPIAVPLVTAFAAALAWNRPRAQAALSFAGLAAFLGCAVAAVAATASGDVLRVAVGGWPAPYGIELALDRLGASLVLVTAVMGAAALVYDLAGADPGARGPAVLPLVHGLLAGVGGAFTTADLFNLYVWFEVMLICSVGLLAQGGRLRHLDATLKYLALNLTGTLVLLTSVGLLYGATGHLNFVALRGAIGAVGAERLTPILALLLLAFLMKAGAFPLFAWLPASYHTLPAGLAALFAGLLTKVGVYAVLRTLYTVAAPAPAVLTEALGWIATATMIVGVLGAAYHWDIRRILGFHIVSQIGYILLAVAFGTQEGAGAALFYTLHHIIVKANLFLIAGLVYRLTGSYDLRRIGGLYAAKPLLAALFLVPALSLIGIPPFSGFWAKFLVLREAFALGRTSWAVAALLVSALTMYSMVKVWLEAFWKSHPDENWRPPAGTRLVPACLAAGGLAACTLWISLNPEPLAAFCAAAAATLGGAP